MKDRLARLESRVEYLTDRVAILEQCLSLAERRASSGRPPPDDSDVAPIGDVQPIRVQHWLALAGRTWSCSVAPICCAPLPNRVC
jgi:hypothetical protein